MRGLLSPDDRSGRGSLMLSDGRDAHGRAPLTFSFTGSRRPYRRRRRSSIEPVKNEKDDLIRSFKTQEGKTVPAHQLSVKPHDLKFVRHGSSERKKRGVLLDTMIRGTLIRGLKSS